MAFQLLPAEESDLQDMVTIFHDSFANDPIFGRTMCDVPANIRRLIDTDLFAKYFTTDKVHGAQVFKAVDIETK